MDPMTLLGLLQAGGSLLQGAFGAAGAAQENRVNNMMQRRRALRLQDVASMLENVDSMARLPAAYSRALAGTTEASRASAAMRGLAGSGVQAEAEARMQGAALAELAQAVNTAEMQRLQNLAAIYSDPAFGALEDSEMPDNSGMIALQGLLGAGMALAPLIGEMGNPFSGGTTVDQTTGNTAARSAQRAARSGNPQVGRSAQGVVNLGITPQVTYNNPVPLGINPTVSFRPPPAPLVPQYGPMRTAPTPWDWGR